jgi:uncharacterized protein (DUF4213/DUF364 family)
VNVNQKIKEHLMERGALVDVAEVRIGLVYTAVMLEGGQTGLSFTFKESPVRGCSMFSGLQPLSGRRASDLLAFLDSPNRIEAAVALATSNALSNILSGGMLRGDALEQLDVGPEDTVGMVGYFRPVLPRLEERTRHILIFEQIKEKAEGLLPEEEAYRLLRQCQVAMITSTTILNHTIDRLLESAATCRDVVLLGASTPLLREAFVETPVTFLSGVVVTAPEEILRIVGEGGGMRRFKNNIQKVNLDLRDHAKEPIPKSF